jgi:hypothetical protein
MLEKNIITLLSFSQKTERKIEHTYTYMRNVNYQKSATTEDKQIRAVLLP